MSLRLRLALAYAVGAGLTVGFGAILIWSIVGSSLRGSVETTLQIRADGVVASIENTGQPGLQEIDGDPPGVFVALFTQTGGLIDATAFAPKGLTASGGIQRVGDIEYLTLVRAAADGTLVVAGTDLRSVSDVQRILAQVSIVVALLGAGVSFAGGWFLSGRALRPIERLAESATLVGAGDLDRRLAEPGRMDEVGRLTVALNRMLSRVSSAVERERLFVAMASHELRRPLATLRAELDDVDRDDATVEEFRHAIREAHADVARLTTLASSLLELAAAQDGEVGHVRDRVRLADLVGGVARSAAPLGRRHGAHVRVDVDDVEVWIDRTAVERALGNLVANAIVHGGGDVDVRCRVTQGPRGAMLACDVLDHGPGLGGVDPATLFGPFARGRRTGSDGAGLGLATVAAAVRSQEGRFGGEERPGGGARFWFSVPAGA